MSLARRDPTTSFFEELYAVVVGLGLAVSVQEVVDVGADVPFRLSELPLFFAYLNVAFALSHASVRYLQLAYARAPRPAKGRVVADLVLGVGHFLWLIALPFFIPRPTAFLVVMLVLLAGRPLRDVILRATRHETLDFDRKVAVIHLATIAIVAATLGVAAIAPSDAATPVAKAGGVLGSLVFGLGLYLYAFDFFFATEGDPDT